MTKEKMLICIAAGCAVLILPLATPVAADETAPALFDLEIGDAERRDRRSPIVLDAITDTASGKFLSPEQLAVQLRDTQILFVGEDHTNMDFHNVQARVIRALHEDGRDVMIGLEMMPYSQQKILNRWSRGRYSDEKFLKKVAWDEYWGYHWEYYREIFWFARDHSLPMIGINAPRDVIKNVRIDGFDELDADDAQHIPTVVDTNSDEHMTLFRAYFSAEDQIHSSGITDEQWAGMFRAQCTWDAVMGFNAMQAVRASRAPDPIIVVLIGAGHVTYGLGAERQIRDDFDGGIASLVPVPVADEEGNPISAVQSSYADFAWGVPGVREPLYPMLGVSLAGSLGKEPTKIIQVAMPSVAERAGFQAGDILLAIGDTPVASVLELSRATTGFRWGDATNAEVRRGDDEIVLSIDFRRQ